MRELKVGDRVTVLVSQGDELPAGATGTVMSLDDPAVKLAGGVGKACVLRSDKPYLAGSDNFCSAWIIALRDLGFRDGFASGDRVRVVNDTGILPRGATATVMGCEQHNGRQYRVIATDQYYCDGINGFEDRFTILATKLKYAYKPVYDKPKPVAKAHRLITKRRQDL